MGVSRSATGELPSELQQRLKGLRSGVSAGAPLTLLLFGVRDVSSETRRVVQTSPVLPFVLHITCHESPSAFCA